MNAVERDRGFAPSLISICHLMATAKDPQVKDNDMAVVIGLMAVRASNFLSSEAYCVLAIAHAARGDYADAIRCQKSAIELAESEVEKRALREILRVLSANGTPDFHASPKVFNGRSG